jgi:hypothetical protein
MLKKIIYPVSFFLQTWLRQFLLFGCDTRSVKPLAYRPLGGSLWEHRALKSCLSLLLSAVP